ncbi:hypothetical protein AGR2A_Lc180146 [Agrobacterium genomosp. 2 str. CFBP 5494]|uniref:Uncharacterized protein n=1 Tax=Agrobacterium genomosp. 2 str. CFBP 5494 TaxID=1183436 RepID=A0A9W5B4A0_9HYPH|nr:hypothetical protein AGR2A_Lc180146 [Agrobacterium genomosp. 2 str. CFBP 5494]
MSGRTGVRLAAKARMGTGLNAIEGALHPATIGKSPGGRQTAFRVFETEAIQPLRSSPSSAVAGRPDRALHVVFGTFALLAHSAIHGSGCQPFICLEKSTGTFAI